MGARLEGGGNGVCVVWLFDCMQMVYIHPSQMLVGLSTEGMTSKRSSLEMIHFQIMGISKLKPRWASHLMRRQNRSFPPQVQ